MFQPTAKLTQAGPQSDTAIAFADRAGAVTGKTLYTILCKCLFSEVTVQAVTELDDKTAHCHAPVPQRHRPFL